MRRALVILAACGSSTPPANPPPPPPKVTQPAVVDDHAKHDEIVAAHRVIEEQQQDALGATCDEPAHHEPHDRCQPSCYATETPDPRSTKKLTGRVEVAHLVCETAMHGPFVLADELDPKLVARAVHGRFPHGHKKGTWQATLELALGDAQLPKLPRGDVLLVAGSWHPVQHPLTKQKMRCVTVSHFTMLHHALDGCASDGTLACEATGNAAARGINVVHYRLDEARALQDAGKTAECQQAALEAVAVSRGMPRWRQYAKLNVGKWVEHPGYRTRFDGTLDEDTLFATAATLGTEAQEVYAACGGAANAPTTATQEQSFHTCW